MRYSRDPGGPYGSGTKLAAVSAGRRAYPRASAGPPRHSSPGTPTGTGSPSRSRTSARASDSGRPSGMPAGFARSAAVMRWWVICTVVSVGPYTLTSSGPSAPKCSVHGASQAPVCFSPPKKTVRSASRSTRGSSRSTAATMPRKADGELSMTVTPSSTSRLRRASGSRATSAGTTTTVPPRSSGAHSSMTETSKAYECFIAHTWPPSRGSRSSVARSSRPTLAWVTPTPLGRPVEPEV